MRFLPSFLKLCFPAVFAAIDWSRPIVFLDKELQKIVRDAALGGLRADLLIKLFLKDGTEEYFFLHVEFQSRKEAGFGLRIYRYNNGFFEALGRAVVSLVLLGDNDPNWRPCSYERGLLGCETQFRFPVRKLLDLAVEHEKLLATGEPSAVVIVANWAAQQTRDNMDVRLEWKWNLTRRFLEAGYTKKDVLELYRVVDWLLRLPEPLEREFDQKVETHERKTRMPYITSIERFGMEKGLQKGLSEGLAKGRVEALRENVGDILEARFGMAPAKIRNKVSAATSPDQLKAWHRLAATCASLEDFQKALK